VAGLHYHLDIYQEYDVLVATNSVRWK
ncbi:unnamed protein product, partial [Allacma fusca]